MSPYLYLIELLLALALSAGAFFMGKHYESASCLQDKVVMQQQSAAALAAAVKDKEATETRWQNNAALAASQYAQGLQEIANEKDAAVAAARSRGLWVNARCPAPRAGVPETAASAAGDTGTSRVRLSEGDAGFLISYAASAAGVVKQLKDCQQTLSGSR